MSVAEQLPSMQPLYRHDWRSAGGWISKFGPQDAPRIVADAASPSGRAKRLDRATAGGHYFSPPIALTNARTYCLDVALRWEGGAWPAVGVDMYGPQQHFLGEHWLVGRPGQGTDLGDTVTPVPKEAEGWHTYRKAFSVPPEAAAVRVKDQLLVSSARKAGEDLTLVGPIVMHTGRCEPEQERTEPVPFLRRLFGLDRRD